MTPAARQEALDNLQRNIDTARRAANKADASNEVQMAVVLFMHATAAALETLAFLAADGQQGGDNGCTA